MQQHLVSDRDAFGIASASEATFGLLPKHLHCFEMRVRFASIRAEQGLCTRQTCALCSPSRAGRVNASDYLLTCSSSLHDVSTATKTLDDDSPSHDGRLDK